MWRCGRFPVEGPIGLDGGQSPRGERLSDSREANALLFEPYGWPDAIFDEVAVEDVFGHRCGCLISAGWVR